MAQKPLRRQAKVSHMTLAKTLRLLQSGPITAQELSEEVGIHLVTAQEWLRVLRKEKTVHICGWVADRLDRDATAVYKLGEGRDKPRRKLTSAERTARYRERQKKLALQRQLTEVVL